MTIFVAFFIFININIYVRWIKLADDTFNF